MVAFLLLMVNREIHWDICCLHILLLTLHTVSNQSKKSKYLHTRGVKILRHQINTWLTAQKCAVVPYRLQISTPTFYVTHVIRPGIDKPLTNAVHPPIKPRLSFVYMLDQVGPIRARSINSYPLAVCTFVPRS